jgi:succinate dehydrogenase / fumarate reductase flavoprotein subunit
LAAKVAELGKTEIDDQYVSQLLVADGARFRALTFDRETGGRTLFLADAVVLAAGGHTRINSRGAEERHRLGIPTLAARIRAYTSALA